MADVLYKDKSLNSHDKTVPWSFFSNFALLNPTQVAREPTGSGTQPLHMERKGTALQWLPVTVNVENSSFSSFPVLQCFHFFKLLNLYIKECNCKILAK